MGYANLDITYEKTREGTGPAYEFLIQTTIDPVITAPTELETALVVQKGDETGDEVILRVGDRTEVVVTPLDTLPATVNMFSSSSFVALYGSFVVADIITILTADLPTIWSRFFSTVTTFTTVVNSIAAPATPTSPIVIPIFPAFARELTFSVTRGGIDLGTFYDGVANRDYTGLTGTEFLTDTHADKWDDYDTANNKYESLRAEAQSLVDAMNVNNFDGVTEENYD